MGGVSVTHGTAHAVPWRTLEKAVAHGSPARHGGHLGGTDMRTVALALVAILGATPAIAAPGDDYAMRGALFDATAHEATNPDPRLAPAADTLYRLAGQQRGSAYTPSERQTLRLGMIAQVTQGKINKSNILELGDSCWKLVKGQ